jgi:hypothetical protein
MTANLRIRAPDAAATTVVRKYTPKRPSLLSVKHAVDFVIAGFPKCGTTTLNHIFNNHTAMIKGDSCMSHFQQSDQIYYGKDPNTMLRGFNCPRFLENCHRTLPDDLPFIVSVRHPVGWIESFYNMFVNNLGRQQDPQGFLGPCNQGAILCTNRAQFRIPLLKFGRTKMSQGKRDLIGVSKNACPIPYS